MNFENTLMLIKYSSKFGNFMQNEIFIIIINEQFFVNLFLRENINVIYYFSDIIKAKLMNNGFNYKLLFINYKCLIVVFYLHIYLYTYVYIYARLRKNVCLEHIFI